MKKRLKRYPIHIEKSSVNGKVYTTTINLPKGSTLISILGEDVDRYGNQRANTYINFKLSVFESISNEMTKYQLLIIKDSVSKIEIDDEYAYLGSSVNHYDNDVGDLTFYHYDIFYKEL